MTTAIPVSVPDLPPLQDGRLYTAEETSPYVNRNPLWLKRKLRAGEIAGGYLGRKAVWSADNIRSIVAQATSGTPTKRPSRGGGKRRAS